MSELFKNFIKNNLTSKPDLQNITIEKIFGQASAREYLRAFVQTDNNTKTSYVIMKLPQGFSSPAEEITKVASGAPTELPFINVQKYLSRLEVPVPQILATDEQHGLILLSDLGDQSFEQLIKNAEGEFLVFYYKKAIDLLLELQNKTLTTPDPNCIAWHKKFDVDLLNWEFNHFLEYGIEDRKQLKVSPDEAQTFHAITNKISTLISRMPQGFVHRDFQSRNIMFHNFEFYLIDFQDALLGPMLYDLVALLRDSYVNINPDELDHLLSYYADNLSSKHPYSKQKEKIAHDFHLISLQRKLKDTGRFQFIHTVKKNSNFLKSVPQSLKYVKHAFESLSSDPDIQKLHKLIANYIEELK